MIILMISTWQLKNGIFYTYFFFTYILWKPQFHSTAHES